MHVISKVSKRGKMVSCVIQDKYDMFRDVGPAASYLFSPHAILGIPVPFSLLGFPWKDVRNGELRLQSLVIMLLSSFVAFPLVPI